MKYLLIKLFLQTILILFVGMSASIGYKQSDVNGNLGVIDTQTIFCGTILLSIILWAEKDVRVR